VYRLPLGKVRYTPLARYPAVERDFSFIFEDQTRFEQIEGAVRALAIPELRSFVPVEIFRGGGVAGGSYSILLRANFQSHERTLREDEANQSSTRIVRVLTELGGTQRA
jgi:phenylalanyl-tRNA synthetase beta chain